MKFAFPAAFAAVALAGAAQAAPSVSAVQIGDAGINAYLAAAGIVAWNGTIDSGSLPGDEIAVAEGRIGNNAAGGDREGGLHRAPSFTSGAVVGTAASFSWGSAGGNNRAVGFTLSRSGSTLSYTLGSNGMGSFDSAPTGKGVDEIDTLLIRLRTTANSTILMSGLTLDDAAPGTLAIGSFTDAASDVVGLFVEGITGDFTLTGRVAFNWTGATPSGGSALAFQIKAFDAPPTEVPAPAALGLFGLGLAGLLALRRRASRA
jgi:hypothetical protein